MPPPLLVDLSRVDLSGLQYDVKYIESINPHRGDMRMLDGVIYANEQFTEMVAFKDVGAGEFWVPGHIPGRPIFPGVLMLEAAAQAASFACLHRTTGVSFLGFVAAENVKFRGQVKPGDRLLIIGNEHEFRSRRFVFNAQGLVNDTLVFEGRVTGMPI